MEEEDDVPPIVTEEEWDRDSTPPPLDDSAPNVRRTLSGLREMADRAAWGEVLELSQDLLMRSEEADLSTGFESISLSQSGSQSDLNLADRTRNSTPGQLTKEELHNRRVQYGIFRIAGFLQTRRYIRAGQELDEQLRVIRAYVEGSDSSGTAGEFAMVPFALRALALEVAARKNDPTVVDQAYQLRGELLKGRFDDEVPESDRPLLRERRALYLLSLIVGYCLRLQRHDGAIDALKEMAERTHYEDSVILFAFARVLLNLGDVGWAEQLLNMAKELTNVDEASLRLHCGLLAAARSGPGDLDVAVSEFRKVKELEPDNIVATNNIAICLLHMGSLSNAIVELEEALSADPEVALDEGLVFNLCTMYDLSCPDDANDKKQRLHRLAAKHGRQGFNMDTITIQRSG